MMVSKVRGRFDTFEAQIITVEDPLQSAATATATVDMNSVNTGNETRDNGLRSDNLRGQAGSGSAGWIGRPASARIRWLIASVIPKVSH